MSNIQRSRSEPHFAVPATQPDSLFQPRQERRHAPRRTKTTTDFMMHAVQARHSPVMTPRSDRGDPFNLGGFFPTYPQEAEEFDWLRYGVEEEREQEESERAGAETEEAEEEAAAEGDADAVIRKEDKLGILTLLESFAVEPETYPGEERLYSPYAEDEPCDEASLYLALCARRAAQGMAETKGSGANTPLGALFLPSTAEEHMEEEAGRRGWGLHGGLQLLAGML